MQGGGEHNTQGIPRTHAMRAQAYEHVCQRCETISNEVMAEAADTRGVLDLKVGHMTFSFVHSCKR